MNQSSKNESDQSNWTIKTLKDELQETKAIINEFQEELAQSSRGIMALTLELEGKADKLERTNKDLQREIKERKKMEDELRKHRNHLEDLVKERTAELQQSEERFRSIVEKSHEGIFIMNDTYQIIYTNDELCRILGYSYEEVITHDLRDFLSKESKHFVEDRYIRRQRGEEVPFRYEFDIIRKDGKKRTVEVNVAVIKDSKGKTGSIYQIIDITERKHADEQIKKSLKEKEVLLREIHHRVKNNLQIVASLLNMQARAAKDIQTIEVLSESKNRINAMALIHSQLYEGKDLSEIRIKEFVDRLLKQLLQNYSVKETRITPIIQVAECLLPISVAVPVGLIINELISNVLKHAFVKREEGVIEISLHASENGRVSLAVSDDGVGLPPGFDIDTAGTLGLRLVKILTEDQLQGNLQIINNEGTTFIVEFDIEDNGKVQYERDR